MSRWSWLASLVLLVGLSEAAVVPARGVVDSRIRTAFYDPWQVYRLEAFVGFQIELVFAVGERFAGQGSGDLDGISVGAHENHVIVKPRAEQVGTNLVIYTNRRAYRFDYVVHGRAPDPAVDDVIYAVLFVYPPEPEGQRQAQQALDRSLDTASDARVRNLNYWFCGSDAVKPTSAFDDGASTHLTFGARAELPAVFLLNDDDSESLLNFSVEAGVMVIHRVARRFIVRRGGLTGCIVNRGYSGGGERLKSGTLTPAVVRERKAVP
ncbi:TrbG/VirB9 family P-type conjugative transfer protein [Povalibacter sp.]|uniref:TrbG/VirB9 family P-type conjugative transfer protein n=1 Tax=Povalibacter sp. TaxID=1962978 RepID=UPI002F3E4ADB